MTEPRDIMDAEISVGLKSRLFDSGLHTDADILAKGHDALLRLPRIGVKGAQEVWAWASGVELSQHPTIDSLLIEAWIAELRAEQQRCPTTPKGQREAAILAFKIGTLQSLLN